MRIQPRGFSLVEIVIALGVLSFAVIAIIGMFPVALSESKDSRNETRAAAIAQLIFGQLRTHNPIQKAVPIGLDPSATMTGTNGNYNMPLQAPNSTTTNTIWNGYDDNGQPVRRITKSDYEGVTTPTNITYKVRVRAMPNQPAAGLARVIVEVTYPPTLEETKRNKKTFSLLMPNTSP